MIQDYCVSNIHESEKGEQNDLLNANYTVTVKRTSLDNLREFELIYYFVLYLKLLFFTSYFIMLNWCYNTFGITDVLKKFNI